MKRTLGFLIVLALLGGAAAGYVFYTRVHETFRGYQGAQQYVDIPAGTGTPGIGQRLVDAGVIRDRATYRLALLMAGSARRLKAGEYRFDRPMTPLEAIDKLARGEVDVVPLTFREGLTITEM